MENCEEYVGKIFEFIMKPIKELYYNEQNFYSISIIELEEELPGAELDKITEKYTTKLVGRSVPLSTSSKYKVTAKFIYNEKYGYQYEIVTIKPVVSSDSQATLDNSYLQAIITPTQYETINSAYPNIVQNLLDNPNFEPDYSKLKGIKQKSWYKIREKILKYQQIGDILALLVPLGISNNMIEKLTSYEPNIDILKSKLKTNPYEFTKIQGFGFLTVDKLALKINPDLATSSFRVAACTKHVLEEEAMNGYLWVSIQDFGRAFSKIIKPGTPEFNECFKHVKELIQVERELTKDGNNTLLHVIDDVIGLQKYYNMEKSIWNHLKRLNEASNFEPNSNLENVIQETNNYFSTENKKVKLTDEQVNAIKSTIDNKVVIITANAGCVDKDTEFFNGKEWKKISEYTSGENVLQCDKYGNAFIDKPLQYVKKPCEIMYHFKSKYGIDQMLSEDHIVQYYKTNGELTEDTVANIVQYHEKYVSGFINKMPTSFIYSGKGIPLSDSEIKVMLAVIADGSFDKKNNTNRCFINIKKERKIIELKRILEEAEIEYKITEKDNGYKLFSFIAPRKEKEFSQFWFDCTKEQLELICSNVLKWDGSEEKRVFFSNNKKTIDFIQFAFQSCGYRASITVYNRIGKKHSKQDYNYKTLEYCVCISDRINIGMRKQKTPDCISKVQCPDGYKYCFTTKKGYLILRRNGRIFRTHNCGKTVCIKGILNLFKNYNVATAALSGKAARRIEEATGVPSNTIHKLLEWKLEGGFARNEDNPLKVDLVVLDECSMIDDGLLLCLLKAMPDYAKLVLVFDDAQLSPIGAGSPAKDLLSSNLCINRLTKIHRQAESSGIKLDANKIRKNQDIFTEEDTDIDEFGNRFITSPVIHGIDRDMEIYMYSDSKMSQDTIFQQAYDLYFDLLRKNEGDVDKVTIVVPKKDGINSTRNFNNRIQERLLGKEPSELTIKDDDGRFKVFKKGARVIQRNVNDYERNVMNGEIGIIERIEEKFVILNFDNGDKIVPMPKPLMRNMELAYAITVHSMQGSECENVIAILDNSHYILLDCALFYTAITRAQKKCYLLMQPSAYKNALLKNKTERRTYLRDIIKEDMYE